MRDFHLPGRSPVVAVNGMAATSHPLAAKCAIDVLQAGGNAVDAAIAAAVLLGICEPQSTGIGGDAFALIAKPGAPIVGLNGSGRAPKALSADAIRAAGHKTMPLYDAAAISVPGAIDMFCTLSADHGKLGLTDTLAPAIHYAEVGIPIAPRVAFDYRQSGHLLQGHGRQHYLQNDAPLGVGALFRAPGQAEVLRRVAAKGRDGFYDGEVADDMLAALNAAGGVHTGDDFAATKCSYVDPISGSYRDHELVELPPNGQGATALLMAAILAEFDLASMDPMGATRAHIEAEAAKLAYNARDRFIAEDSPRLDHMLAPQTAKALAALIDPDRAMPDARKASDNVHKDTVYITVVDEDRLAVSLIYSIFHSFGSGLASEKFGVLFQNRGGGFNLEPGHVNEAAGGKRPMHTIIPGMLKKDGKLFVPFGVMGGAYQPCGHARMMSNMVDFGMDAQSALDGARSFPDAGELQVERGYRDEVHQALADKGHKVVVPDTPLGGGQAIVMENDVLIGASDPRKDGCALGY